MKTVEDLMTPNPKVILSSQPLTEVVRLFLEKGISSTPVKDSVGEIIGMMTSSTHRILVRDEQLKIIGIISPKDLLRIMLGEPGKALI